MSKEWKKCKRGIASKCWSASTPVVFLDIDGVLNSGNYTIRYVSSRDKLTPMTDEEYCPIWFDNSIDPSCVSILVDWLKKNEAVVVISSSWRKPDIEDTIQMFEDHYPMRRLIPFVVGQTTKRTWWRSEQIQDWIDEFHPEAYLILDDSGTYFYDKEKMMDRFVETDNMIGLTEENLKEMTKKLKKQR